MFRLLQILLPVDETRSLPALIGRAVLLAALIVWTLPYFTVKIIALGEDPGWMHHVHLVFHEAGHAITAMLTDNRTAVVFMGSGLQVLFPLIIAGAFYFVNKDAFAAALGLWWAGHAALDVAPYIGDARLLNLELLTGGTGKEVEGHDWEYLLEHWGVLHREAGRQRKRTKGAAVGSELARADWMRKRRGHAKERQRAGGLRALSGGV